VGGWGRDPFSRNLMSPTPRRKWYLTTGVGFIEWYSTPSPNISPYIFLGLDPSPPPLESSCEHATQRMREREIRTICSALARPLQPEKNPDPTLARPKRAPLGLLLTQSPGSCAAQYHAQLVASCVNTNAGVCVYKNVCVFIYKKEYPWINLL